MKKEEYIERYGKNNKTRILEIQNSYRKTKYGRALHKISRYNELDKIHNRGECTLTVEQFISLCEKGCYWCGEKDWRKLGVDRIDNSKPHSIENCVCSCGECNTKRNRKTFEEYKDIIALG